MGGHVRLCTRSHLGAGGKLEGDDQAIVGRADRSNTPPGRSWRRESDRPHRPLRQLHMHHTLAATLLSIHQRPAASGAPLKRTGTVQPLPHHEAKDGTLSAIPRQCFNASHRRAVVLLLSSPSNWSIDLIGPPLTY